MDSESKNESRIKFGDYELLERLGRGGMATVYRAREHALNRIVAIKVLAKDLSQSDAHVSRFTREAQAMAQLDHPNIVAVHTTGSIEGRPFIAMEYIGGGTLLELIQREAPLPQARALSVIRAIAHALITAHAAGVIHRDIKPQNILIDDKEQIKVADFGLAKVSDASTQLTLDGTALGTPRYMSPEQCSGGQVDGRTDVYSLGIVLFELLTKRPAFSAESALAMMNKIAKEPLPHLTSINRSATPILEEFVIRMTAKNPQQRYAACELVLRDCDNIEKGKTLIADFNDSSLASSLHDDAAPFASVSKGPTIAPSRLAFLHSRYLWIVAALTVIVIGAVWFSSTENSILPAPSADQFPSGPFGQRILNFPKDRSVGEVYSRPWSDYYDSNIPRLAAAQGRVVVPAGHFAVYKPNRAAMSDWTFLKSIGTTDLDGLDFTSAPILDADYKMIRRFPTLRVLRLGGTVNSGVALRHIEHMTRMRHLDLTTVSVHDDDLEHLSKMIDLRVLRLDRTPITGEGLRYLEDLEKLEELNLDFSNVNDDAMKHLENLKSLTALSLVLQKPLTDAGVAHLAGLTNMRLLIFAQHAEATDKITDKGLTHLRGMTQLRYLHLAATQITDDGVASISHLKNLDTLYLSTIDDITDRSLKTVGQLGKLQFLDVNSPNLSPAGLGHLVNLSRLTFIHVDPDMLNAQSISSLQALGSLRTLAISHGDRPSVESLSLLTQLRNLKHLELQNANIDSTHIPALMRLTFLDTLHLDGNNLNQTELQTLRTALPGVKVSG